MKLLVYKPDGPKLEEIAVDINLNPVFLTAIEMIDDEVFLGADGRHIFVCQKNRFVIKNSRHFIFLKIVAYFLFSICSDPFLYLLCDIT